MALEVTDYGATMVSILAPDAKGRSKDVLLGYDDVQDYEQGTCYFGAIIGRNGNRTKDANVSHEFKTPLASIHGFAKLLQSDDITEQEREEYTQIIIDETSRLSKLSSNILRLTKLENQKTVGKKTRFSLDEQIRKILLVLEPEWSKKKIDLDIDLEDIMYVGSEELMAQIWQNIINNAIKFTPEGGKISVKLFRNEKNISAEIWDNGPSIAPDVKAKIFDKFYQGDRSRATEGNGLGLALVKRIIELSEGSIEVENDMKKGGVCFRISLPYLIEDMM